MMVFSWGFFAIFLSTTWTVALGQWLSSAPGEINWYTAIPTDYSAVQSHQYTAAPPTSTGGRRYWYTAAPSGAPPTSADCNDCDLISDDIGYLPNKYNPRQFYQCERGAQGSWTIHLQHCAECTIWNQTERTCMHDPKRRGDPKCIKDVPVDVCSLPKRIYYPGQCLVGTERRRTSSKSCFYDQFVGGKWIERQCPLGTAFDLRKCCCIHSSSIVCDKAPGFCLNFTNELASTSGDWVGSVPYNGVRVTGGIAYFPGYANLVVYRFQNTEWKSFLVTLRFKQTYLNYRNYQGLVSDDSCKKAPNFSLYLLPGGRTIILRVKAGGRTATLSRSLPYLPYSDWIYVRAQYTGTSLTLLVTRGSYYSSSKTYLSGIVHINACSPLVIGAYAYPKQHYFYGYMDDVCLTINDETRSTGATGPTGPIESNESIEATEEVITTPSIISIL